MLDLFSKPTAIERHGRVESLEMFNESWTAQAEAAYECRHRY